MRGKNTVRRLVAGEADVRTITTTMRMPREKNEQIRNRLEKESFYSPYASESTPLRIPRLESRQRFGLKPSSTGMKLFYITSLLKGNAFL